MSERCANPKCRMLWNPQRDLCSVCQGDDKEWINDVNNSSSENIIKIDRSVPFDPVIFLGKGWNIIEEDERSLALTEIDINKIQLMSMRKKGENITLEENFRRLKNTKHIRLDAKVFQVLWENKDLISKELKYKISAMFGSHTYFFGTALRHKNANVNVVLYLYGDNGQRHYHYSWFKFPYFPYDLSAVL